MEATHDFAHLSMIFQTHFSGSIWVVEPRPAEVDNKHSSSSLAPQGDSAGYREGCRAGIQVNRSVNTPTLQVDLEVVEMTLLGHTIGTDLQLGQVTNYVSLLAVVRKATRYSLYSDKLFTPTADPA
jgi:hypothetical protein